MAQSEASPTLEAGTPPAATTNNIVVLCDGTANQVNINSQTNVLRLAHLLRKDGAGNGVRQVMFYSPGLGTESAPGALTTAGKAVTKFLGLAFGYGLSKNLADAYFFVMQHYRPGDRIYIFGFSRGAYTARALAGLLGRVGLLERGCENLIPYAIKYFHARDSHQLNFFKQRFSRTYSCLWEELVPEIDNGVTDPKKQHGKNVSKGVIPVHFLGVWDTVKSIGTLRRQVILPDTDWLPYIINGRHAVALDERRSQFQCDLWSADTGGGKTVRKQAEHGRGQVCLHKDVETMWFAGVHADVGGGYGLSLKFEMELTKAKQELTAIKGKVESDALETRKSLDAKCKDLEARNIKQEQDEIGLALISLEWMIDAARNKGLSFDDEKVKAEIEAANPLAMRHDELHKIHWRLLGAKTRQLPPNAKLHPTVQVRIKDYKPEYKPAAQAGLPS